MKFRRISILFIVTLQWNLFYPPLLPGAPRVQFSIVYTNDVMGEVEPCG